MSATTAYVHPCLKLPDKKIISMLSKIGTSSSEYRFVPLAMRLRLNNVTVGMPVTGHPPYRSRRARFAHRAPALGVWR